MLACSFIVKEGIRASYTESHDDQHHRFALIPQEHVAAVNEENAWREVQ